MQMSHICGLRGWHRCGAEIELLSVVQCVGLGSKQQEHGLPSADDRLAEQGDADGPTSERRERRERPPRSARRERGQRERLPRPSAAAAIDSGQALPILHGTCFPIRQRLLCC